MHIGDIGILAHGRFKFRFGQSVRVVRASPDCGATGRVIAGQRYSDGRETYCVDIPGGSWLYEAQALEGVEDGTPPE